MGNTEMDAIAPASSPADYIYMPLLRWFQICQKTKRKDGLRSIIPMRQHSALGRMTPEEIFLTLNWRNNWFRFLIDNSSGAD